MFHVKPLAVLPALVVVLVFGVAPHQVSAGINKCTGADGKLTFSDQSCPPGLAPAAIKPLPGLPKAAPTAAAAAPRDSSEAARAEARERLRAAQTPECRALQDRFLRAMEAGGAGAEIDALAEKFESQCAARLREAIAAEAARAETERNRLVAVNTCASKRRVLDERRPRLASLSEPDRRAFSAVEAEVARDCR